MFIVGNFTLEQPMQCIASNVVQYNALKCKLTNGREEGLMGNKVEIQNKNAEKSKLYKELLSELLSLSMLGQDMPWQLPVNSCKNVDIDYNYNTTIVTNVTPEKK